MAINALSSMDLFTRPTGFLSGGTGPSPTGVSFTPGDDFMASLFSLNSGWNGFAGGSAAPGFPPALALPDPAFGPFEPINVPQVGDGFLAELWGMGEGGGKKESGKKNKDGGSSSSSGGAAAPGFPPFLAQSDPAFGPFEPINVPQVGESFLKDLFDGTLPKMPKMDKKKGGDSAPGFPPFLAQANPAFGPFETLDVPALGDDFMRNFPTFDPAPFRALGVGFDISLPTPDGAAKRGRKGG